MYRIINRCYPFGVYNLPKGTPIAQAIRWAYRMVRSQTARRHDYTCVDLLLRNLHICTFEDYPF